MMDRSQQFSEMFERFIGLVTDPDFDDDDRKEYLSYISKFCEFFNLAKSEAEFYLSANHEQTGRGERIIGFDNGRGTKLVHRRRIITRSRAIILGSLYMSDDAAPLSDEDLARCDLVLRSVLSYISRNRLQATVEQLGFYDEAGFRNMRYFVRYLFQTYGRNGLKGYTAVRFNLRRFALVNMDIGRIGGDIAMKSYYNMFDELFGENGVICRMGGDNFVGVFTTDLLGDVMKLLSGVAVNCGENKRVMISSTAGIFRIPDDFVMTTSDDVMDKISAAASDAKTGSDNITIYDEKVVCQREKVIRIQSLFGNAVKDREFRAFYQPKVDVVTGKIVGAEALCRWFHGDELIMPGDFIPVLELNSDICRLDFYMLETVCRDIRRWMYEGREVVRVSVNLSRKHLVDIDLVNTILGIIDRNFVPHEYIELELTETIGYIEFDNLKNIIEALRKAGIATSVDDFGAGYSSLNLLREIPWNVLKVDRCFVPACNDGSATSLMFRHVINMAHDLGLGCIAEGVETEEQVEVLRANNCRVAQGFYFDRPLPVEEFEKKLGDFRYEH